MSDKSVKQEEVPLFAILRPEVQQAIAEAFDGEKPELNLADLPTVVYPGAGGDRWIVKHAGEEERVDAITGIVVAQRKNRGFYFSGYTAGSSTPPDCSSQDAETGRPQTDGAGRILNTLTSKDGAVTFGGSCASCPLSQWGSRALVDDRYTGDAQACREGRVLLVLPADKVRPYVVRLPATAIRAWSAVAWELVDRGLGLSRAVLTFTLSAKSGEVPQLKVSVAGELPPGEAQEIKNLMPSFKRPQLAAPAEPTAEPIDVEPF